MKNSPYVGPRPYERGDRHTFYGREREARDLLALILAEPIVLFYAASGAGKTSLLNAKIIPGSSCSSNVNFRSSSHCYSQGGANTAISG
jgi:putative ribosome biogenesis GTPase RsgA